MRLDRSIAQRGLELHEEKLRPFLLASMAYENPIAIGLALLYEMVSIVAAGVETDAEAQELLDKLLALARNQIEEFGVGRPHP
jgi:hypothetical protein